jgi:two-component system KDP operon response regulator KdpE
MASSEQCRVLVAIDDPVVRQKLVPSFGSMGVSTEVTSPERALDVATFFSADVVVLSSSDARWIDICQQLRGFRPDAGIVVALSGPAAGGEGMAFEAGADDVIAPPYRFRELVARIRSAAQRPRESSARATVLQIGELELDANERRLRRAREEIHLSPQQFDLLLLLMRNPDVTLNRIRLLQAMGGRARQRDSRHLRAYINALRHKIETDPARPQYILTEPWVGYRFHNPDKAR